MHVASSSALIALLVSSIASAAEVPSGPQIPAPLRPWVAWVLDSDEGKSAHCPSHSGVSTPVCAWPARLALNLSERGGTFSQEWMIFKPGFVTLPGDKEHWPVGIKCDGKITPVIDHGGEAQVALPAGHHVVTGIFQWDALPESLLAPAETGLIALALRGKSIAFPMRESDGRIFLGRKDVVGGEKEEDERIDIQVYRKLTDATPLALTTHLVLSVSGKNREILLGKALPVGFEPVAVESALPLRFEGDGRLRVQARRGVWNITIQGHRVLADKSVTRPVPDGSWKEGDEAWVLEAKSDLRTVVVEGVPAIDPALTLMPAEWKSLPAYAVAPGATLVLSEQQRGDAKPVPDRLKLDRTFWLDSNGRGFSVRDTMAGEFTRSWRLEMGQGTRLGRLAIDSHDQFITRAGSSGRDGVEIRAGRALIEADSRVDGSASSLPATGFAHAIDQLSSTIHWPVGWDLLHASGADKVSGSWIERWSLGQLVLLLVLVVATWRLYGWRIGVLSLAALGITFIDVRAPALVWLFVLGGELLARAIGPGPALVGAKIIRVALWLMLLGMAVPFAIAETQFAIHPASAMDRIPPSRFADFLQSIGDSDGRQVSADLLVNGRDRFVAFMAPAEAKDAPEYLKKAESSGILGILSRGESGTMGRRHKGEQGKAQQGLYALKGSPRSLSASPPESEAASATIGTGGPHARASSAAKRAAEYDPSTVVQSGEGLPRWSWKSAKLAFNGAVASDRTVDLYFIPPWLGRILALVKVGLLSLLAWFLVRRPLRLRGSFLATRPLVVGLVSLLCLLPSSASASEFPSQEILDSLKQRLLAEPECSPDCTAVHEMALDVSPANMRITLHVSAAAASAIALPGDASSWSPSVVLIDGKPASALQRGTHGNLWVAVTRGWHTIKLAGPLPSRDSIQLPLPMRPHRATVKATGFKVSGVHEDGAIDESVLLERDTRSRGSAKHPSDDAPILPPFLRVERNLVLGLTWEVHTKVTRETPVGSPLVIEIPLLPGELATTAGIRSEKARDTVSLSFAPDDREVAWDSTLAQTDVIHLRADAATAARWFEIWRVEVGPAWHATFSGIPPVRSQPGVPTRIPEWRPWPGEDVHIAVEKPSGVAGQTLTVDASTLTVDPGVRSSQATLRLEMRSSRGTEHRITLPPASETVTVMRDGHAHSLRQEGKELVLTVPPGNHTFEIKWRQPVGLSLLFRAPAVDVHLPSANSSVNISLTENPRWLLWVAGPAVGPIIGYWIFAGLLLFAGFALARTKLTPLRIHHWFLLGLGLLHADLMQAMLVSACLLALGWRARTPQEPRPLLYDVGQLILVALAVAAVVVLINTVDAGLWRSPGMIVSGNNSADSQLHWYQDRAGQNLAQPWMLSLPLWGYRVCVLAWVLWLVLAGAKWATWAWACFSKHGLWRPIAKPFAAPPEA